jgi:DNA-binding NarL/FixJ family response regulator
MSLGYPLLGETQSMKTRILLADDHRIVREGLRCLIENQEGMSVVGEAATGIEAVRLAREHQPDIVIIDIAMPDLNGVDATRQILEQVPQAKVIALSMHGDRRYVSGMLDAGASGYLLKDSAFEELTAAVRTVLSGEVYLSPKIATVVLQDYRERLPSVETTGAASVLTPKERSVLQLIAEGRTTKETARKLGVSPKTIETHRHRIMKKLDIWSVAELTKFAIREGLTSTDAS